MYSVHRPGMSDFKKLIVWQKAHAMALDSHRLAGRIRRADHSALRSQIIRAAMSVPTNIVEGSGQASSRKFSSFLQVALNSTTELEYHLLAVRDLNLVRSTEAITLLSQVIEVRKMIHGLLRRLATRSAKPAEA